MKMKQRRNQASKIVHHIRSKRKLEIGYMHEQLLSAIALSSANGVLGELREYLLEATRNPDDELVISNSSDMLEKVEETLVQIERVFEFYKRD